MKQAKVEGSKSVLNCLWGFLASRNIRKIKTYKQEVAIDDLSLLKKMYHRHYDKSTNTQHYSISFYNQTQDKRKSIYKFKYARFTPFLTARGRRIMYKFCKKRIDNIVRIHTDGVILSKPIEDLYLSNDLGDWKMKQGPVTIKHINLSLIHI